MFDEEIKEQLKGALAGLDKNVNVALFIAEEKNEACVIAQTMMEELSELSDKLILEVHKPEGNEELTKNYNIDKLPAIVLLDEDKNYNGIKFYGAPGGYEINSFIRSVFEISGIVEEVPADFAARINSIDKPVHIQIFVTLGCPYCPNAVIAAHLLALLNENVQADMIDTATFSELADKYKVSSVPHMVINEEVEIIGAQPLDKVLDAIDGLK